jgi:hypothetical protein
MSNYPLKSVSCLRGDMAVSLAEVAYTCRKYWDVADYEETRGHVMQKRASRMP